MHLQSGLSALLAASRGDTNPSPTLSVERSAISYPSIDLNGESSNTMPVSDETSRENGSVENHNISAADNTNIWEESSSISDVTLDSVLIKASIGSNRKGPMNGKSIFSKAFSSKGTTKSFGTSNSDEVSSYADDTIDFDAGNNSGKIRGRSRSYTGDNATSPNSKVTNVLSANDPFPSNFTATYQVLASLLPHSSQLTNRLTDLY